VFEYFLNILHLILLRFSAKEMTKRGRNNLNAKRSANNGEVPKLPNGLNDCNKISSALGYGGIGLGNIKFAA
jgi:hypothetical protein